MIKPINQGTRRFPVGSSIGPARWRHHDLIIVSNGEIEIQAAGVNISCPSNSACLIPPGVPFEGRVLHQGTILWVQHFSIKPSISKRHGLNLPLEPTLWPNSAREEWIRSLMQSIEHDYDSDVVMKHPFETSCKLHLLLSALCRHPRIDDTLDNRNHNVIQRTLEWLEAHPWPLPGLAEICAIAGWSESYFRLQFKHSKGRSIGGYLRSLRHAEARRLLRETHHPIKEISFLTGYSDTVSFCRAFTNEHGVPPGRYRNDSSLV